MSIRFDRVNSDYLRIPQGAAGTFPASTDANPTWAMGVAISLEAGAYDGTEAQVMFCPGGATMNVMYHGTGPSTPNTTGLQIGTSSTSRLAPANTLAPLGKYIAVFYNDTDRVARVKVCPVLTSNPTNGSAVQTFSLGTSFSSSGYTPTTDFIIGNRPDLAVSRRFDGSLSRIFRMRGLLTDLEVAKLAYGMSIIEIGKTPEFYFPMDDENDLRDLGTQANVITKVGTLVKGSDMGYGYVAATPSPPAFTTSPVINGTPASDSPVSYTPGTVTGAPPPEVTHQWKLNGTPVSNAPTFTAASDGSDIGKMLTVTETATNSQGTAQSTSAPATVQAGAPPNVYTVNDLASLAILHNVNGFGTMLLSGTYSGNGQPVSADVRIYSGSTVVRDWEQATDASFNAGSWSAKGRAPVGNGFTFAVRFKDADGAILGTTPTTSNLWDVGFVIGTAGSSSAFGWNSIGTHPVTGTVRKVGINVSNGPAVWSSANTGSNGHIMLVANALSAQLGMSIGIINSGSSGTTLSDWVRPTATQFSNFSKCVMSAGGKIGGLMFTAGSNDAAENGVVSQSAHLTKMRLMISMVRNLVGNQDLPVLWSGFNRRLDAKMPASDWVRTAETRLGDDDNVCHVQTVDLTIGADIIEGGDDKHLTSAGYRTSMERALYQWPLLNGGLYRRGPKVAGFTYQGNSLVTSMQHRNGTDFTPAENITGLTVTDGAGTPAIVSSIRISPTQWRQTFDRNLVAPVTAKYLSGFAPPIGTQVFDNGTMALPMTVETDLPAVEGAPPADEQPPVLAGTLTVSGITQTGATVTCPVATDDIAVAGYEFRMQSSGPFIDNGTSRVFTRNDLTPATQYQPQAQAYDTSGKRSNTLTATTFSTTSAPDTAKPVQPGPLNIVATIGGGDASWPIATDNVGIARYERQLDGGAWASNGTSRSYSYTNLSDSSHTVSVRAVDTSGNISEPITATFTPLPDDSSTDPADFVPSTSRRVTILPNRTEFAIGDFWQSGANGPIGEIDPDATLDIPFDLAPWLADIGNVNLDSVVFLLSSNLSNSGSDAQEQFATVFVSPVERTGTATVTIRWKTDSTPQRSDDRTVYLEIKEQ